MVSNLADNIEDSLKKSIDWINSSPNDNIKNNYKLIREFHKSIVKTNRLSTAAAKPMSIGVYGASQSGKSYFISALAKGSSDRVEIELEGINIDFLTKINPPGGKESTSIVTRFTHTNYQAPNGFPIYVKLISNLDLICIFCNSFFNDVELNSDEDFDSIKSEINNKISNFQNYNSSSISYDIILLEEYCDNKFSNNFYYKALKETNYWSIGAEIFNSLTEFQKYEFLNVLWRNNKFYNDTYNFLYNQIKNFEFASDIFCPYDVLFLFNNENQLARKQYSIINVESLDNLNSSKDENIVVSIKNNKNINTTLATIGALASEIIFYIPNTDDNILKKTDLLDFPGARSRHKQSVDSIKSAVKNDILIENFLRGKIAYLFEQYTFNYELTALILCVGPSNQEVVGLDQLIENWIIHNIGTKPENRSSNDNSLFLVLTKFDTHFNQDLGHDDSSNRWETRIKASIEEPFSGKHSIKTNWLQKWSLDSNFKNTFWYRSISADQHSLVEYFKDDKNRIEKSLNKDKIDFISNLKNDFLNDVNCSKYFIDPNKSWDEVMKLNDGGISYIKSNIEIYCSTERKFYQIKNQLVRIIQDRMQDLEKYFINNDSNEIEIKKNNIAKEILKIGAVLIQINRFGEFLYYLTVSDDWTRKIIISSLSEFERQKTLKRPKGTENNNNVDIDATLASLIGLEEISAEKEDYQINNKFIDRLILDFFEDWKILIKQRFFENESEDYFYLNKEIIYQFLIEIEALAFNKKFMENLKLKLEEAYKYRSSPSHLYWKLSAVLTSEFNNFISKATLKDQNDVEIEMINGRKITIFKRKAIIDNEIILGSDYVNPNKSYFVDWINAIQFVIRYNHNQPILTALERASNDVLSNHLKNMQSLVS
jgi:hypothetical protein